MFKVKIVPNKPGQKKQQRNDGMFKRGDIYTYKPKPQPRKPDSKPKIKSK
jgi:hypothetical protein